MRKSEQHEIEWLINKINLSALAERATFLRNGVPCVVPPLSYDRATRSRVMGGMNYHIDLKFSDGVVWIARIRRVNATSPPLKVRDAIFSSEVATLKFLEQTGVPAPKVHDFALEGPENAIGVSYMLQEKMAGRSCSWSLANPEQKSNLLRDLADVFIELSAHSFDSIGSPVLQPGLEIGPFARESLTDIDSNSTMKALGPFHSLHEYHTAEIDLILDLIRREETYAQQPVDAYLIHLFLLEILPCITRTVDPTELGESPYFLTHPDDKGDHILVDENFRITAVIDWEWAHTVPPALAFNSPIMLFDVGEFYDGNNTLSKDEEMFAELLKTKGRSDLAGYVRGGRLHHRFAFCCGYDLTDWSGFLGLFRGLRKAVGVDMDLEWEEWKRVALERYCDDAGLKQVLAMEKDSSESR
jgi:hypothetical protein